MSWSLVGPFKLSWWAERKPLIFELVRARKGKSFISSLLVHSSLKFSEMKTVCWCLCKVIPPGENITRRRFLLPRDSCSHGTSGYEGSPFSKGGPI